MPGARGTYPGRATPMAGDDAVTVYVYKLRGQFLFAPVRTVNLPWFGLTADTEEELHPFAETIGMYRHFYHPADPPGPPGLPLVGHYDVDQGERDRAVARGARPISARKRERMLREQAAGRPGSPG
jgi:hypothetical protein